MPGRPVPYVPGGLVEARRRDLLPGRVWAYYAYSIVLLKVGCMEPLRAGDPRQVGPYRLQGRLGGGGMGQVFLGRSRGGRPVAVKVVRPELADDAGFRRRFAVEVEAARRVGGFYTAQVVDADPDADPPWLVTAYIPGPSLYDAVEEHEPLPPAAIGVLGAGLAEGLAVIHGCDVVHRDLKPGNVILAADGPRVIDFGIARALDATSHTVSGIVIGTPAFMSPEQVRSGEVGPASDVFSLGAVLVFAATGRGPFGIGQGHAIMYRIVNDEPDLTGLPRGLVDLVGACLAKTPQNRPSLTDLLDRLAAPADGATRWLPPEVTAIITRLEQDLSEPSGDAPVSGPGADPKHRSGIDHAIRIACSTDDPDEENEVALYKVAEALIEADPDHAEQHLQRIPSTEVRAGALLLLAEKLSDTDQTQRLIGHAEQLIAQILDDGADSVRHEWFEVLVALLISVDPQQALATLDRVERRVVDFDKPELRAMALASEAGRVAATAPGRASSLMDQAVEAARMIPPDPDDAYALPGTLTEIAKAGYSADRRHAERLIDLAETTALDVDDDRDWALKWTSMAVAEVDPARAEQLISKITKAYVRASAWQHILKAAASTPQDHRPLIDAAERSVAEPVAQEPAPVKPGPWWGRRHAKPKVGDDQRDSGPWYLRYIATGAAWCDPSRAEAIASRITDAEYRSEAFSDMAGEIAEANPLQARWWLSTAYRTALEAEARQVLSVMGKIAAVGTDIAPGTAQQAAQYIAGHADGTDKYAGGLIMVAEDVVAVDPELAVHLIDLAETQAQQRGRPRLDEYDLVRIAKTLMAVATAWADSMPERTEHILRQVLDVAVAAQSTTYLSPAKTAGPNPQVVEQLLQEYNGAGRDHLRYIAASVFAATDALRAEQLAREITDDSVRYAALDLLAESIIKQAVRSAADPGRSSPTARASTTATTTFQRKALSSEASSGTDDRRP